MTNYTYHFLTDKSPEDVFGVLLAIEKWWSGIHEESIIGESQKPNDEFSFTAGGGMHFTKQKMIELIPNRKIVWQIIQSNLSFLEDPNEWKNTKLAFDISEQNGKTQVQFTHIGLKPGIECYSQCSSAWSHYFANLEQKLNSK